MDNSAIWCDFFRRWPAGIPAKGVVITSFGEQIPFSGFLLAERMLILQRSVPDTQGTRLVALGYGEIVALKYTEVFDSKAFAEIGFQGTLRQH